MNQACIGLALALWLVIAPSAGATERILDFESDIVVQPDGSLLVTETIRVQSESRQIRRGIFRDFPTDYRDPLDNRYRVGFDLRRVTRDGLSEPARLERRGNGVRVYIGSADRFLRPGIYTYQLEYETTRQLGFFEQYDELYWNATGNGWAFPIDQARVRVTLPTGIDRDAITVEGFTGVFNSKGQNYEAGVELDGAVRVVTTRTLQPGEGLTLAVTWPKGFVAAPSVAQRLAWLFKDNAGLLIVTLAALLGFAYLAYAWHRVGRDPKPGVIFPHYEPPEGFSPASLRYVSKRGYDKRAFTAAVLNLAVKGLVDITESDGDYTVARPTVTTMAQRRSTAAANLASGEQTLLDSLFRSGSVVELKNDNYQIIQATMSAHEAALASHYRRKHFINNRLVNLPAWLVVILATAIVVLLGLGSVASYVIVGVTVLGMLAFAYFLEAHTELGRRLLDKVEGFQMYLEVAEQDDLNLRNPPEKTPELFETYLPFALALNVEQPWAEQFADVFARLSQTIEGGYRPRWYQGNFDSRNPMSFAADMGDSLNSAISSAASPPGSASGSGGGGSSGGGGGGGGGGGW
jgi:uncharacterized membrane protein YgcG